MRKNSFLAKKKEIRTRTATLQSDQTFKGIVIILNDEDNIDVWQSKASYMNMTDALSNAHYHNANNFMRDIEPESYELLFKNINRLELKSKGIN